MTDETETETRRELRELKEQVTALDVKVDQLLAAYNMGRGASLTLKVGFMILGGFAAIVGAMAGAVSAYHAVFGHSP